MTMDSRPLFGKVALLGIPLGIGAGIAIGMLVRGIGSIGHDAAHGAVSKSKLVSYVVGVCAWSATLFSFTLYRAYHLDHHKIVNMPHDIDRVPVVQPRAPQGAIVEAEAEAADQVQPRPGRGTQPGHVPGVRRNLRFP